MKRTRHSIRFGGLGGVLGLALLTVGCAGRSDRGEPPPPAQIQQQNAALLNDPHVPDSIKQHLKESQAASQAAARGYSADLQQRRAANR